MRRIDKNGLRLAVIFLAGLMLVSFAGCGVHKPFALFDESTHIKKGSVAVISGDSSEPTGRLADYLTQELKQKSTFRVLSQAEIGRRIGKYPIVLKRAVPENVDKPIWFAKGEKNKLDAMHARLKTDYMFVVWTANLQRVFVQYQHGGGKVSYYAGMLGNLYEYPRGKAIAYSNFGNSKDQSCCLFGKSEGDDINALLKYSAEEMTDDFLTAAKAEKPRK
jgi:hypothetical protein